MTEYCDNPSSNIYRPHFKGSSEIKKSLVKYKLAKPENDLDTKKKPHTSFMTSEANSVKKWFLDSYESRYKINDKDFVYNYTPLNESIGIKSSHEDTNLEVIGIGDVLFSQKIDCETFIHELKSVGLAPKSSTNLISDLKIQKAGS